MVNDISDGVVTPCLGGSILNDASSYSGSVVGEMVCNESWHLSLVVANNVAPFASSWHSTGALLHINTLTVLYLLSKFVGDGCQCFNLSLGWIVDVDQVF